MMKRLKSIKILHTPKKLLKEKGFSVHLKRSCAFMLLELLIANIIFLGMITTIMGWQSDVLISFARLKERVELLRSRADCFVVHDGDDQVIASKYRVESHNQVLYLTADGQKNIARVLGSVPDYRWYYTKSVLSTKRSKFASTVSIT